MCMLDDDSRAEIHFSRWQRARKTHRCAECARQISAGERYEVAGGVWDGAFNTFKTCGQCVAVREWLNQVCSGWIYGYVREDIHEHFHEGYGVWLGRAYIGMKRGWLRKDGSLMPPMALPANIDQIRA